MTNKEREDLKNEIAFRDVMTRKMGKYSKYCLLAFLLFGAIAVWGFSGMQDNFVKGIEGYRDILKWIALVIALPSGIFSLLFFISYSRSKKYVFTLIDKLQGKK